MRYHYWQFLLNQEGQPISNANIYIYEAGTTTPITVYTDETQDNYESSTPQLTTNSLGYFEFWLGDESETYGITVGDKIKIKWVRTGVSTGEIDNIEIFRAIKAEDINSESSTSGQLLVSDGSGNATWQTVSTGISNIEKRPENFFISEIDTGVSEETIWGMINTLEYDENIKGSTFTSFLFPDGFTVSDSILVDMIYVMQGEDAGGTVRLKTDVYINTLETSGASASPNQTIFHEPFAGTSNENIDEIKSLTLSAGISGVSNSDDFITLKITRDVTHGDDDYLNPFNLLSMKIYQ